MKKNVIIGLIILVGILGIGFVYLNNVYVPKHLKPMVVELLKTNLKKDVTISKAFYFPLKGVLFSKIDIKNPDQTPFLEIEKVDFGLKSFPRVTKNEISIKARLVVQGVAFKQQTLEVNGGTVLDLDLQIKGKENIAFSGVILLNNLGVKGIEPVANITKIQGKIICEKDAFYSKDLSAIIGKQILNISLDGEYDKENLFLNKLDLSLANTNLSMKGRLSDFENLKLQASGKGKIDLKDIALILSGISLPSLSGECMFTFDGKGTLAQLDAMQAQALLELGEGAVDKIRFSQAKAQVELANGVIKLTPLTCMFYDGSVTASGKATITSKEIPVQFSADTEGINIQPLVKDIMGEDIGAGLLNAHIGISGPAVDLNLITGSGWFKVTEAEVRMPPNFKKVANSLGAGQLAQMQIQEASATFSISDGKIQTEDLIMLAKEATISGKGYIDLEQYVDFETVFKLSPEFVQSAGGTQGLFKFISDESGASLAKVKVYDHLQQLQYKIIPLPVQDIIKSKAKGELQEAIKGIFGQDEDSEQSEKGDLQEQLKEGLKRLFK